MRKKRGMNQLQYAAHAGISRGAVQKAIKTSRMVLYADGSINASASDRRRAEQTDPSQQRGDRAPLRQVPAVAVDAVSETIAGAGGNPSGLTTFVEARTANEVLKAQQRKLALDKANRNVVDFDKVKALVFRIGRQERDAWLNWPARVAAIIAAEVGVDGMLMRVALDKHVREHLNELSEIELPSAEL